MEVNFVQIGDGNFVNLINVARVRFSDEGAEVFYIGGQSESITSSSAIANLRRAIGAATEDLAAEPRKAMDVAHPSSPAPALPMRADRRR